jgi:hypothetical protein
MPPGFTCDLLSARRLLAALLVSVMMRAPGASAMPDLKIIVRDNSALRMEKVTYIQNDRKRVEERRQFPQRLRPGSPYVEGPFVYVPGPPISTITRCDLDQIFVLNLDDREYTSMPVPKPPSREELQARAAQQPKPAIPPQPTLLIETTTQDTGERKKMFGYTARHVITTRKQIPLVDSDQTPQETATDGWYIDLDTSVSCDRQALGSFAILTAQTRKPGEPFQPPVLTFKNTGEPERGLALVTKEIHRATFSAPDGSVQTRENTTYEMQVTELSTGPLDATLFEVPKNFRKVSQIRRAPIVSLWNRWLGWLDYYWARLKRAI